MKKKVIVLSSCIVLLLIICFGVANREYPVLENSSESRNFNTNVISMMYETETGSGEYQVTSDTTWPQEGYVFNEQLSACENGSTLSWDDENKRVLVEANVSDKCYIYFDVMPYSLAHTIGSRNTMEVSIDESGRLIASAIRTASLGNSLTEVFHLVADEDITNLNIRVRYNPNADVYRGRVTISYDGGLAPDMEIIANDMYVDGEPIILSGNLYKGEELVVRIVRKNYSLGDSNIDFIVTGDGLIVS